MPEEANVFGGLFNNVVMMGLYIVAFILFAVTLVKIRSTRKGIHLPRNLYAFALCAGLWIAVSVLRFLPGLSKELVYILSLLPYIFPILTLAAALFFVMRFYNLGVFCLPHILIAFLALPFVTLLNIYLGYSELFGSGSGANVMVVQPQVYNEGLNYVYGTLGAWHNLQFALSALLAVALVFIVFSQHLKLPHIYRPPSEKIIIGTIFILIGYIAEFFTANTVPVDFPLLGTFLSVRFFHSATLGSQGLVFLSQARNDIFQNLEQSVLILDDEKNIIFKNAKAAAWLSDLKYTENSYPEFIEKLSAAAVKVEKLKDEESGCDYHFTLKERAKVYNLREKALNDNKGNQIGTYVVYSDESENRALIQRLEVGAGRDALTGLHNRSMMESLKKELDKPDSLPLAAVIADLNDLKKTNDVHGHQAGDIMLRVCGEALSEKCPPTAQAGRIGGDEFLILLPQTAKLEAEAVMQSIRDYLKEIKDYPYEIVMSMGCCVKENTDEDIGKILITADELMYDNKKSIKGAANVRSTETQLI
jgi:diguanylate cyclase (GGDEF)-like protein